MAQAAPPAFWGGDEVNAIVIDVGAASVKAGYAGEDTPRAVFPSVVGRIQDEAGNKTLYAGHQALTWRRDFMEVVSPFEQGQYKDWDVVSSLWDHVFKDRLRIKPDEHPMMLAEPPFNSRESREKMVEVMFENYAPPALFLGKNAVLSSFATGRPTSLVVDVGHEGAVGANPVITPPLSLIL